MQTVGVGLDEESVDATTLGAQLTPGPAHAAGAVGAPGPTSTREEIGGEEDLNATSSYRMHNVKLGVARSVDHPPSTIRTPHVQWRGPVPSGGVMSPPLAGEPLRSRKGMDAVSPRGRRARR